MGLHYYIHILNKNLKWKYFRIERNHHIVISQDWSSISLFFGFEQISGGVFCVCECVWYDQAGLRSAPCFFRSTSRHLWLSSHGHRGSFSHSVCDNEGETRNALKSFPFSSPFSFLSLYHSFFTSIMTPLLHTSRFLLHYFICDYGWNDSFLSLFRCFSIVLFMNAPCSLGLSPVVSQKGFRLLT